MSTSVITGTSNTSTNSQAIAKAVEKTLGKDDFLKLLTTELTNQDPMQAMDNKEFVSQMAQFSSLEVMSNVASALENLREEIALQGQQSLIVQGAALIGKQVLALDANGESINGTVESVNSTDKGIELQIDDTSVNLADITSVLP